MTLWALSSLMIVSIQWMQTPILIKSLGDFLDALGGYYVVRFLIRDLGDVRLCDQGVGRGYGSDGRLYDQ